MATDQDALRLERYKWFAEQTEGALNAETVARDAYLTVKDFTGTHTLGPVSSGFKVYCYNWGTVNSGFSGGGTSGGGAAFQDLYVVIDFDNQLPSFLTAMAKPDPAKPIEQAVLYFLQQDSSQIGNITLKNLFFTDIQVLHVKSKQNRPVVLLALSYQQININVGTSKGGYNIPKGDKA